MKKYNRSLDYTAMALAYAANGQHVNAAKALSKAVRASDCQEAVKILEASNQQAFDRTIGASAKKVASKQTAFAKSATKVKAATRVKAFDLGDDADAVLDSDDMEDSDIVEGSDDADLDDVIDEDEDDEGEVDAGADCDDEDDEIDNAEFAKVLATLERNAKKSK